VIYRYQPLLFDPVPSLLGYSLAELLEEVRAAYFPELAFPELEGALEARSRRGVGISLGAPAIRDEHLFDDRLGRARRCAQARIVTRHDAPAKDGVPLRVNGPFDQLPDVVAVGLALRQEDKTGAILARRRQCEPEVRRRLAQEPIGHLHEHTRAVAGIRLRPAGAAVQQVEQDLQALFDDGMGFPALDVHNEADAACVVLVARIVETGGAGHSGGHGPSVIAGPEPEVKYNDPIESMRYRNGLSVRPGFSPAAFSFSEK